MKRRDFVKTTALGAAAVVLVALVFMKRRKDGENEERE